MRPRKAISLLVGALAIWPTVVAAADDIRKLADQAIRRLDLQTTLPTVSPPPPQFRLQLPPEVMWLVIAVAIGVLLYAFRDMIPFLGPKRSGIWTADEEIFGDSKLRASAETLSAADELAAHGHFVEAMHALLLQGLTIMRERLNEQFSESLTSREILNRTKLPQAGRNSLGDIIRRVEWTHFGKRHATRADYDACRSSFAALTQALHGAAVA